MTVELHEQPLDPRLNRPERLPADPVPSSGIDRTSPLPYYHQLKSLLRAEIARSKLVAGDRLPGDHQLCSRYAVSRTVVRQALSELEFEGVIERVKGRGTFVAAQKTSQGLVQSLTGLFEDLSSHGMHLRSEVRRFDVVPADETVAEALRLPLGEPVVLLDRLRFVGEVPLVVVTTYLPVGLLPGLVAADLRDHSLYAIMERAGVRPVLGQRVVEARPATSGLARDLGLRRGAPILLLSSIGLSAGGRPVETFRAYHRGDRTRFEVALEHRAGITATPLSPDHR